MDSDLQNLELKRPEAPPTHFDPTDELSQEEISQINEKVEQTLKIENFQELNLQKSKETVPGQEWCLVSFVGDSCNQKTQELGMKVWGCFDDIVSAKRHADKISKIKENQIFDIYILEMYSWARIPPKAEFLAGENQIYQDNKLNELITEHRRQQMRAKELFETRRQKLSQNPDVNQYHRNKEVLKALMGETPKQEEPNFGEYSYKTATIQNADAHRAVFGTPLPLPKLEIVQEPVKTPFDKFPAKVEIEEIQEEDNDYNKKFYNQSV